MPVSVQSKVPMFKVPINAGQIKYAKNISGNATLAGHLLVVAYFTRPR
jgi:hypothetical protein